MNQAIKDILIQYNTPEKMSNFLQYKTEHNYLLEDENNFTDCLHFLLHNPNPELLRYLAKQRINWTNQMAGVLSEAAKKGSNDYVNTILQHVNSKSPLTQDLWENMHLFMANSDSYSQLDHLLNIAREHRSCFKGMHFVETCIKEDKIDNLKYIYEHQNYLPILLSIIMGQGLYHSKLDLCDFALAKYGHNHFTQEEKNGFLNSACLKGDEGILDYLEQKLNISLNEHTDIIFYCVISEKNNDIIDELFQRGAYLFPLKEDIGMESAWCAKNENSTLIKMTQAIYHYQPEYLEEFKILIAKSDMGQSGVNIINNTCLNIELSKTLSVNSTLPKTKIKL